MDIIINKLEKINNKMDNLKSEIEKINQRLETIENKLNIINDSTNHMDNHIQFVENVYDKIKQPLIYTANKISSYMASNLLENTSSPEID
jgi:chromosome segregation ATPase